MSKQRALKAINFKTTDRIPSMDMIEHPEFIKKISKIDPFIDPFNAMLETMKKIDIDMMIEVPKHSISFKENESKKITESGNIVTKWSYTGSLWEEDYKFLSEQEVLDYNPFEDVKEKVRVCSKKYRDESLYNSSIDYLNVGNTSLMTGIYYTTLFQFFIMTFGWEMFLITAAMEGEKFKHTIDLFTEFSIQNTEQWAKTIDSPIVLCHDDIAIARGLVFPPEWYRKNIFPSYERIFEPFKKAGKKILFVSDGNYLDVIDDIFALGVDGVMVQNETDLKTIIKKYGKTKIIIGNVSTEIITYGTKEDIYKEVKRCTDLGKDCEGYFIKAAGELPHNVPIDNMEYYFDFCKTLGKR